MEAKRYQVSCESPLYFGNTETIQEEISQCKSCGSKLIFQHMPNYKDLILKEIIRCASCSQTPMHQMHRIH